MSIFSVISGFVLVNFRAGARADELRLGAENAAALIRDAAARATAGAQTGVCVLDGSKTVTLSGAAGCPPGAVYALETPRGWGASFGIADSERIRLFADLNGDGVLNLGEEVEVLNYSSSGFVRAESASPAGAETTIVFVPPSPEVLINGAIGEDEARLTLEHTGGGGKRTVSFNRLSRRVEVIP